MRDFVAEEALDRAESIVIGAIASYPSGFAKAARQLAADDFTDHVWGAIFAAAQCMFDRTGYVPDIESALTEAQTWGLEDPSATHVIPTDIWEISRLPHAISTIKEERLSRTILGSDERRSPPVTASSLRRQPPAAIPLEPRAVPLDADHNGLLI